MIFTTLYFFNVSNVQPSRMDLFVLCVFMCMCVYRRKLRDRFNLHMAYNLNNIVLLLEET